jgi:hypothetical protein
MNSSAPRKGAGYSKNRPSKRTVSHSCTVAAHNEKGHAEGQVRRFGAAHNLNFSCALLRNNGAAPFGLQSKPLGKPLVAHGLAHWA